MKKILLPVLLFVFASNAEAQWVSIPDTNFGTWLKTNYSACMQGNNTVGWQLDTTCNGVIWAITVNCSNKNIADISGIQYFDALRSLYCSHNQLTFLPAFTSGLRTIDCSFNQLSVLPSLPLVLQGLTCNNNYLTQLPALPAELNVLGCGSNLLDSLPTLPVGLQLLVCDHNPITGIVLNDSLLELNCGLTQVTGFDSLPFGLRQLVCGFCPIAVLPSLPGSLYTLTCQGTQITSLPVLPAALRLLSCSYCHLSSLPALPPGLQSLYCTDNQLTWLPALPDSLLYLSCSWNQITNLPEFPESLIECSVNHNPIACLPRLKTITNLDFSSTNITCLPNYGSVSNSNPPLNTVPLCGISNTNGCPAYWNISGKCYYDSNSNCLQDTVDVPQRNIKVKLLNGGNVVAQAFTGGDGYYSFDNDSSGTYQVMVDTVNIPLYVTCPANNVLTDTISNVDSFRYSNNDFALACKAGFDLSAWSIGGGPFRPANFVTVNIRAGDLSNFYGLHCAAGISGDVRVIITGPVKYVSPAIGALTPSQVSGDTITWNIADFGTVDFDSSFNLTIQTDTTAVLGSHICFSASVTSIAGDNNPADDTLTQCFSVESSFDPNEKEVYPSGVIDTAQHQLIYTIRFQNTGNSAAGRVCITDTLDSDIDETSFQLLAYSHQPLIQIKGHAVRINFPNINLPDSNANEPRSHGYVQYKVKLKDNLPMGTQIKNKAFIYFDFNAPVVTSTATNIICTQQVHEFTINTCSDEPYFFKGAWLNQSGDYRDTLVFANQCDSIRFLHLTVFAKDSVSNPQTICSGETVNFFGQQLDSTGTYNHLLQNTNGCDSVVTLELAVLSVYSEQIDTVITQGNSYTLPTGNVVTLAGTYIDTLQTIHGCDSVITTNLSVATGNQSPIPNPQFAIYPNPTTNHLNITVDENLIGAQLNIYNITGALVLTFRVTRFKFQVDCARYENGVYIAEIKTAARTQRVRWIKM